MSTGADPKRTALQPEALPGVEIGPALGGGLPLRVELILNPHRSDPLDEPFIVLNDIGRPSRVYLGRILMGHGSPPRYFAVKFQTPRPPFETPEEEGGGLLSHPIREKHWLRELGHYQALAPAGPARFTPVLFLETPPERSGLEPSPRAWPPMVFCNVRRALFAPLSASGRPLVTCRDEKLLQEHGLPSYKSTPDTFLYNKEDVQAGAAPLFYQSEHERDPIHPPAQTIWTAFEEQSRHCPAFPGAAQAEVANPSEVDHFVGVASAFPCMTCPEKKTCYPSGPHAERLEPFLLEDSHALVLELNRFHYDEFCDVLGGVDWPTFQREYLGEGAGLGQQIRLHGVESLFAEGRRYLFDSDGSGMDALEIFKLKWTLWAQACASVLEYHSRCGVAHLRIEPRHLMIQTGGTGPLLPELWQFNTRLISLGSMAVENDPGGPGREAESTQQVLAPPMNANPLYDAEIIRNSSFGVIQRTGFILTSIEPVPGMAGSHYIKADLHHDGIGMPWIGPNDRIKVTLRNVRGLGRELSFMSGRDMEKEPSQRLISVKSDPVPLTDATAAAFKPWKGNKIPNAGFVLYPLFGVPCDLFSLGMLLFRTLIVNDRQSMGDVAMALEEIKQELNHMTGVNLEEGMEQEFWSAIIEGHHRVNVAEIFNRHQVFTSEDDRRSDRPNAIPESIWTEALVLGLQMVTDKEDFSICLHHGDFDWRYPSQKMEIITRRSEEILRKIDTALLSMSRRNAEVRAALDAVLAEVIG